VSSQDLILVIGMVASRTTVLMATSYNLGLTEAITAVDSYNIAPTCGARTVAASRRER